MKLLRIRDSVGEFRDQDGGYKGMDRLTKEDLLALVNWTLNEEEVDMDEYDESALRNQAHQIVYRSVFRKLLDLRGRRQAFRDESARLFLEDYEKYKGQMCE